ncbi:MAG: putative glycoside hydrolase [Fimbriimonadales bacterium]
MERPISHGMRCLVYAALALSGMGCGKDSSNAPAPEKPVAKAPTPPAAKVALPKKRVFAKPDKVRGIYLTAWSAGGRKKMDKMLALLDRTELNALVIDIRDAGHVYVKTGIEEAVKSGAETVAIIKPEALMDRLEKAKVYPIARIACFRDVFVPKAYPERAVNLASGGVWKDGGGYTWLDPYNQKNWDYLAKIVDYALDLGFPEIQLDYVRFPSEGKATTQVFPAKKYWKDTKDNKPQDVVAKFAQFIAKRVRARGAVISADIFGIISSSKSDQGIGQELEMVAEPFDLVCPMVYPSHFAKGEYGIANPDLSPYAIIVKSLRDYAKRIPNKPLRPWLQDFSLGSTYGPAQVEAQIKAAREVGYNEYLLWNAKNVYSEEAVR